MEDVIRSAIKDGEINPGNISFSKLKQTAGRDLGYWEELGRGREILSSVDHLDQYLYSYGPMTESQWNTFLAKEEVSIPGDRKLTVTDYGSGQGLAMALVFDGFPIAMRDAVRHVVLIEPSGVALARAVSVVKTYVPKSEVYGINKKLDDAEKVELRHFPGDTNVHVFSNVLDIEGINRWLVFNKILDTRGRHIVLAVSHNRNFHGGSDRIRTLASEVSDKRLASRLKVESSIISEFNCQNGMPAISWYLRFEVIF